jgi:hypothetical protein
MSLHDRIGIDLGCKVSTEDGITWVAANDVYHIDSQIDLAPNALATMLDRAPAIWDAHERAGIDLRFAHAFGRQCRRDLSLYERRRRSVSAHLY